MNRKKTKKRNRKQKSRNKRPERGNRGSSAEPPVGHRRFTALIITLVSLCGVLLAGWIWIGYVRRSSLSTSKSSQSFDESGRRPVQTDLPSDNTGGLPPAPTGQTAPVNQVDPLTGKPISATSPTTTYKGYIVAFCCPQSRAYNGGWNQMKECEKDAFVLDCFKRNSRS